MKNLIFALIILLSISAKAQTPMEGSLGYVYQTVSEAKSKTGVPKAVYYILGGTATTDFRGAFYVWDDASVLAEDLVYYNVIQATGVATGRYIRTNQTNQELPQGMLFRIGPLKILACSGVTNASGEFTVNATLDNTSGGTAIFSSILFNATQATSGSTSANDAVNGTIKSVTNGKVVVYRYTKGNTIGILGALSIVASGSNVPVQCFIVGM